MIIWEGLTLLLLAHRQSRTGLTSNKTQPKATVSKTGPSTKKRGSSASHARHGSDGKFFNDASKDLHPENAEDSVLLELKLYLKDIFVQLLKQSKMIQTQGKELKQLIQGYADPKPFQGVRK